ncbi:hypothetical protein B0H13DRAFT_2348828 [Mycena leptocephala]|nr:hypothetical protein B0H13DRAFT_2348828 [Mycena leptocephala]
MGVDASLFPSPLLTSMYRSKFRSLHIDNNSIASSTQDEDSADTLLDSATTLLRMPSKAPKRSWFTTSRTLRLSSLILHSALVAIHLALVGIWARGLEHRFTVALENEKFVSFLISATTTAFGTIYSALLVFATQTLSMRRSLQMDQVLTATHDNAAAWAGVGAAISYLWSQKTVPARASMIGVLTAALYLTTILGLHITTSSLFSLVTVDSTRSFHAKTHGLPSFNNSPEASDISDMEVYAAGSLYYLPSILDSNATVDASGFNVTCGYVLDVAGLQSSDSNWWESADRQYAIPVTQPGMISTVPNFLNASIILYSTIPIVDSSLKTGPKVNLTPPMITSVSSIQIFQCSLSLVNQTATVDAQSRQFQALGPGFKKAASTWVPYVSPMNNVTTNGNCFIDSWATWFRRMPSSDFQIAVSYYTSMASVADIYLIQKLNLPAANHNSIMNVTLHEVENALSIIVASMFWTLGHIPPSHRAISSSIRGLPNGTSQDSLSDVPKSPILLLGNANVTEIFAQARLELSIIAVSAGLAISIILMLLALPSLLFHQGSTDDKNLSVNGTGILHAIWLYRNHPELETLLEQVEHPTDDNLRAAGLVQTRLVGEHVQKEGRNELF